MPQKTIKYIRDLPEFDADTFKEITGIDIEKTDKVEIIVEGNSKWISRESAKTLNLI